MSLFNRKIIDKHRSAGALTENQKDVLTSWAEQIDSGTFQNLNEIQVQGAFTQQIMCKLLGYSAVGEAHTYTVAREYPVARGRVDLALGEFVGEKNQTKNTVLAAFELKGADTKNLDAMMPGRHKTPVQQAFEYARDIRGAKWVLISNYVELRLYAISETSLVYEQFFFKNLIDPEQFSRFSLLLSAENFLSGRTEALLKESENADKDITEKLYEDYKLLRGDMVSHLIADNGSYAPEELIAPAQKLLDRILFIAFAEDKGLIPNSSIKKAYEYQDPYSLRPTYQQFVGLFRSVDQGNAALDIPAYNGGLFAKDDLLDNLVVSDELCEGFKYLSEYDFDSEVSVTVLGHIFEQSIADLEILTDSIVAGELPQPQAKSTSVSGKRKKHGVVYTPDNITLFIVSNTLGVYIEEQFGLLFAEYGKYKPDGTVQWRRGTKTEQRFWYKWQEKLQSVKVVDPACGSGAFMIASFDVLYAEYEKTNEKLAELTGQRSVLDLNKEILNNNLFGVDINEESIEITKLSLWLKTAEKGKALESLDANFIAGNSLGFDEAAPDSKFYWTGAFPDIFSEGGFDVVLGNPPYVRQEKIADIKPWLQKKYSVYHGVLDLYGYFYELGISLLNDHGKMAFISNSSFFKSSSGEHLRKYLQEKVNIAKIIDFGDVQVFEGVTTYPAILVLDQGGGGSTPISILKIRRQLPIDMQLEFGRNSFSMNHMQLTHKGWHFESTRLNELRLRLMKSQSLEDRFGTPYRGLVTGLNDAFIISNEIRESIINTNPQTSHLIKPFIEGKDIKRWHCESRDQWIIAIPKGWTRECMGGKEDAGEEAIAWDWFKREHPQLSDWLRPFSARARKRGDKGEFWWELRSCAYYEKFSARKIFYPDITDSAKFFIDEAGYFSSNTGYFLSVNSQGITAYLNSNLVWFLLRGLCDSVRGGYYRMFSQSINALPIPDTFFQSQDIYIALENRLGVLAVRSYQVECGLKRRLEDLCPHNETYKLNKKLESWWELEFSELQKEIKRAFKGKIPLVERNDWQDFFESERSSRIVIQQELSSVESQLNAEVYKLFALTKDEIVLIENDLSM